MVDKHLFKVCSAEEWQSAVSTGHYAGSTDDRRDGFIHLSAGRQLPRTLAKFFAGRTDLVLLALRPQPFGEKLRWEAAGQGDRYPHLYDVLRPGDVAWQRSLTLDVDGVHLLPEETREC